MRNKPFSHIVQMLPRAEHVKANNSSEIKGNSFFEEMLALDQQVLKVLE